MFHDLIDTHDWLVHSDWQGRKSTAIPPTQRSCHRRLQLTQGATASLLCHLGTLLINCWPDASILFSDPACCRWETCGCAQWISQKANQNHKHSWKPCEVSEGLEYPKLYSEHLNEPWWYSSSVLLVTVERMILKEGFCYYCFNNLLRDWFHVFGDIKRTELGKTTGCDEGKRLFALKEKEK